jgi:NADPH2:quinone reductase
VSSGAGGKKVVVTALGETPVEAMDRFVELVDQPEPERLGPEDVLVEVKSASVGWVDLIMTSGQYQHVPEPPYTPGLEYAGVVRAKGAGVGERLAVGDAVLSDGALTGPRSSGEHRRFGGWATFAVAPAAALHRIPGDLGFDEACNLLGNYETAYHCLVTRGRLAAGESVLILGASGATGLSAVQLAKLLGARVIATGRSPDKLALVKQQGADHVLVTASEADGVRPFRDEVKALTDGRGADVVYDGVGGALSVEALRAAAFGARFLIVGWAATPFVAKGKGGRGAPNVNQLPTNLVIMKSLDVLGCPTVIATQRDPSLRPPRLRQILAWAEAGAIRPHVSHRFPLADIGAAMRAKWSGAVTGGAVVHPPAP